MCCTSLSLYIRRRASRVVPNLLAIDISRETHRVEGSPGSTSSSTSAVGRRVTELGVYIAAVYKHTVRLYILNTGAACPNNNIGSSSRITLRRLHSIEKCGKINSFVMHDIAIATSQRHYFDRSALNYGARIRAPLCDILMFEIIFLYARWVMPAYVKNISKTRRIIKLGAKFYRYHMM